jgi:hypothetical protein
LESPSSMKPACTLSREIRPKNRLWTGNEFCNDLTQVWGRLYIYSQANLLYMSSIYTDTNSFRWF